MSDNYNCHTSYYIIAVKKRNTKGEENSLSNEKNSKMNSSSLKNRLIIFCVGLYLAIPFGSLFFENYIIVKIVIILLCVICVLSVFLISKKARIRVPFIFFLLFCFYIYVLLNNNYSIKNGSLTWFLQFICSIIIILALLGNSEQNWTNAVLCFISVFGCFYSIATITFWIIPNIYDLVYPLLQSLASSEITGAGYKSGLTSHYSTNGMYIALGFLTSGCLGLSCRNKKWSYVAVLCLFALLLTSKRAHLAFGLAAFVVAYFIFNSKKTINSFGKVLIVSAILVIVLYIFSFVNSEILEVFVRFGEMSNDDTMNGRSGFYELCVNMFQSSPLFGNGWGSYTIRFNQTIEGAKYYAAGFKTMNAHNVYLQVLAEEGLIGFAILFITLILALSIAVNQLLKLNHLALLHSNNCINNSRVLLAASIGLQIFFLMYCFTGNPLYDIQMYIPYLFALGIESSVNYKIKPYYRI